MSNTATIIRQQAKEIATIREGLDRRHTGNDFQILKNLLKAMETVSGSLSLKYAGTAPLFMGLSMASIGLKCSESETGIIGPSLDKLIDRLVTAITAALIPEANQAQRDFLIMATTATYILMTTIAIQTATQGLGKFSKEMEQIDLKLARFFSYELALKFINSTTAPVEWFTLIIEAAGGNKKAQEIGAPLLGQAGNLLMIIAGTEEGKRASYDVLSEERKYLNKGVHAAITALASISEINDQTKAASIAAQQLLMALEQQNNEHFIDALSTLLESQGTSLSSLIADIKRLRIIPHLITYLSEHTQDEEVLTGIINIA